MNIAIAGYGYVGKAIESALQDHYKVSIVDPAFNKNTIKDIKPDAVIICVSTPQGKDGKCDVSNVIQVINETSIRVPVLIKSTISLEGWKEIQKTKASLRITFSPEFLRARTAIEDFKSQKFMYLSQVPRKIDYFGRGNVFWKEIFLKVNPDLVFKEYGAKELILAKYFRNSFLATKVSFFNQIFDLCEEIGTDYETVRRVVTDDSRIGEGHSVVTKERGYKGHCLPKDAKAIVKTAEDSNTNLSIIKEVISYNKKIRIDKSKI
jgi:UDPglucose 6-dehydrogenase